MVLIKRFGHFTHDSGRWAAIEEDEGPIQRQMAVVVFNRHETQGNDLHPFLLRTGCLRPATTSGTLWTKMATSY